MKKFSSVQSHEAVFFFVEGALDKKMLFTEFEALLDCVVPVRSFACSQRVESFVAGHPWGTPEMIIERTRELADAFVTSEITFVFKYGGMPLELAQKSMDLFAREVMPAIKELKPEPLTGLANNT